MQRFTISIETDGDPVPQATLATVRDFTRLLTEELAGSAIETVRIEAYEEFEDPQERVLLESWYHEPEESGS